MQVELSEPQEMQASRAWPPRRIAGWTLIGLGMAALVVAGDVRTNWIVGDIAPEQGEVALPRLGWMAVMLGLGLLAWHQARSRRSLSEDRYRGPSILALLALCMGLSVLVVLPVRGSINLLFEGGMPDWPPLAIWIVGTQLSLLAVSWVVLRTRSLSGLRPFADSRPIRHLLIGIGAGVGIQAAVLAGAVLIEQVTPGPAFQVGLEALEGLAPPGVPIVVAAVSALALAPFAEELFFRGLALNAWLREYGLWPALIGSAILFGLVHYGLNPIEGLLPELPRLALMSAGGLVLGLLAIRTGSLIAPISAHATMNGMIYVLALLGI